MIKMLYVGLVTTLFAYGEINPFALDENMQKIEQAEVRLLTSLKTAHYTVSHSTKKVKKKIERDVHRPVEDKKGNNNLNQHAVEGEKNHIADSSEVIGLNQQAEKERKKERRMAQIRHNQKLKKAKMLKRRREEAKAIKERKRKHERQLAVKKQVKKENSDKGTISSQAYIDAIKEVE